MKKLIKELKINNRKAENQKFYMEFLVFCFSAPDGNSYLFF